MFAFIRVRVLKGFVFLLLAVLFVGLVGCGKDEPIRVGVLPWIGYQPIKIAEKKGLLPEFIQLSNNASATQTKHQLMAGELDAGYLTLDETLSLIDQGVGLTVVLIADISAGADKVLAREPSLSKSEISRLTIGYEKNAVGELLLHAFVQANDLSFSDVEVVDVPYDQQLSAWQAGQVDILITYPPNSNRVMKLGQAYEVFTSKQIPKTIFDVLAVKTDYLASHYASVQGLVDAHFAGLDRLKNSYQDASYIIADNLGISQQETIHMIGEVILPSRQANCRLMETDFQLHIDQVAQFLVEHNVLDQLPKQRVFTQKCVQ